MIDKRRLANNLTDAMVRLLHFQEKGEPVWANLTYAGARDLSKAVPKSLIDRYWNEALFHNQVRRAVSTVLRLIEDAERATDQPEAAAKYIEMIYALGKERDSLAAENAALRKAVKGFLDDCVSADGMYDMKYYAREFLSAMEASHDK